MAPEEKEERSSSKNPEVQEAMTTRDDLLEEVREAVKRVDRLLQEYAQANGVPKEGGQ
jgi:hypothetical protein